MACLRWGIASAGLISNDFCVALKTLNSEEHKIVAVAARSLDRAKEFAERFSISKGYGSYEELANDEEIDVVYIGVINTQHVGLSKMMLNCGKSILCEKPLAVNLRETKEVLSLAKEKKLFCMEAIWSRFFPAYDEIRSIINSGKIGDIKYVYADFGVNNLMSVQRIAQRDTGGGVTLDLGIYVIQLAVMIYGDEIPEITTRGWLTPDEGVDETAVVILKYTNNRLAVLTCHGRIDTNKAASIVGTNGSIEVLCPFYAPTKIMVNSNTGQDVKEFPLPDPPSKLNFRNGSGMRYEAEAVRKCVLEGKLECEIITHKETETIAAILQKMRHDLGYILEQDRQPVVMASQ
ncbi:trans-1,2-dihydrobenzene-1,2-diol dehydrogenase-like [Saccoglossus kowalevskii]|uniref:Trans-1,2-dihydrobenzene-1,2-diol dehydrogenase n=1 Tax=Saccoglossus kowalevskii TaxID=10224 RepID=A0ABM0N1D2_SACKO|nr:PREDICTED: trans-1,2-dihydrobenzene-1,2-diol dehydrogenase-like [Saccoglossus kowalevskii]